MALNLTSVAVAWSGGVDSTGVLAGLLSRGYAVTAVTSDLYEIKAPRYYSREALARAHLRPALNKLARDNGAALDEMRLSTRSMWQLFSYDGKEMPMRNKRWLDVIMAQVVIPRGWKNVAMGEYVGVDTWLVRDHVPQLDCDHRALSAYLLHEYGIEYRFISLQDFGESRYKSDRVAIGHRYLGGDISLTTNCMRDVEVDCGECYKCIERAAAFESIGVRDRTIYAVAPQNHPAYHRYLSQMQGEDARASLHDFKPL